MPPMPSSLLPPCGDPCFFVIKYLMINLTKCFLAAKTFAFIRCQAFKCGEKIGLKLELENCGKTKSFSNLALTIFSCQIALKI